MEELRRRLATLTGRCQSVQQSQQRRKQTHAEFFDKYSLVCDESAPPAGLSCDRPRGQTRHAVPLRYRRAAAGRVTGLELNYNA